MDQTAAMSHLLEGMSSQDAADLLASLSGKDLQCEAARRLFDHWATASPQAAAAWAQGLADPLTAQPLMVLAAQRWANTDLNQAASWARGLPQGLSRTEIMSSVASEAVRSAPLEALRLGAELPAGEKQTELLRRAAAEWATTDRDGALAWAGQIEDANLRQQVTGQVVSASADQDPALAATIALREMAPGTGQDRALVTVIGHWVQKDPEGASAWLSSFPDGKLCDDAMESLVNLWANRDLAASGSWLQNLPSSPARDKGVLAYSRVLERTNPDLARQWASSLTQAADR